MTPARFISRILLGSNQPFPRIATSNLNCISESGIGPGTASFLHVVEMTAGCGIAGAENAPGPDVADTLPSFGHERSDEPAR
jgi:hypothetical protein